MICIRIINWTIGITDVFRASVWSYFYNFIFEIFEKKNLNMKNIFFRNIDFGD